MSIGDDDIARKPSSEEPGNRTCLVMGMIFGGIGGVLLLCGGCCFGTFYFRVDSVADDIEVDLLDNPVMVEHIGEVESLEVDLGNSMSLTDDYVFRVAGSQNSGTITANCVEDANGMFHVMWGQLDLDNGESYDLFPDGRDDLDIAFADDIDPFWSDTLPQDDIDQFVREDLADHAVIAEHVGEIQRLASDMQMSVQEPGDIWIFEISGEKGQGQLRANCVLVADGDMDVDSGVLMLDSGENVQLFPENPMDPLPDTTDTTDSTPEPTEP